MFVLFYIQKKSCFVVDIGDSGRVSSSLCMSENVTQMRRSQAVLLLLYLALSQVVRSPDPARQEGSDIRPAFAPRLSWPLIGA